MRAEILKRAVKLAAKGIGKTGMDAGLQFEAREGNLRLIGTDMGRMAIVDVGHAVEGTERGVFVGPRFAQAILKWLESVEGEVAVEVGFLRLTIRSGESSLGVPGKLPMPDFGHIVEDGYPYGYLAFARVSTRELRKAIRRAGEYVSLACGAGGVRVGEVCIPAKTQGAWKVWASKADLKRALSGATENVELALGKRMVRIRSGNFTFVFGTPA